MTKQIKYVEKVACVKSWKAEPGIWRKRKSIAITIRTDSDAADGRILGYADSQKSHMAESCNQLGRLSLLIFPGQLFCSGISRHVIAIARLRRLKGMPYSRLTICPGQRDWWVWRDPRIRPLFNPLFAISDSLRANNPGIFKQKYESAREASIFS
jgi:hypothetical protein